MRVSELQRKLTSLSETKLSDFYPMAADDPITMGCVIVSVDGHTYEVEDAVLSGNPMRTNHVLLILRKVG